MQRFLAGRPVPCVSEWWFVPWRSHRSHDTRLFRPLLKSESLADDGRMMDGLVCHAGSVFLCLVNQWEQRSSGGWHAPLNPRTLLHPEHPLANPGGENVCGCWLLPWRAACSLPLQHLHLESTCSTFFASSGFFACSSNPPLHLFLPFLHTNATWHHAHTTIDVAFCLFVCRSCVISAAS